jgi:protein-disulfide isomerase/uncharacterized membrane protein
MSTNQQKGLTLNGMTPANALYAVLTIGIIITCAYLTKHYYNVHYPSNLSFDVGKTMCDINQFFNCDAATFSPIAQIAGIPLSIFGLVIGVYFLFGLAFPSEELERSNFFVSIINSIGCLALFIYSLAILGSLCPFCTLYYVLSWAITFLLWKRSFLNPKLFAKPVMMQVIVLALFGGIFMSVTTNSKAKIERNAKKIVSQFFSLPDLGAPEYESPFKLTNVPEGKDMPIKILIFSDFQCPYCMKIAHQFEQIARKYQGQVDIRYYFYPLDQNCNKKLKRAMHPHACQAAYLSACDPEKFWPIHDEIFENQGTLSKKFLQDLEKKYGLSGCFDNMALKEIVQKTIAQGESYNVKSTPTILINGVKIEGSQPSALLFAIFDEILNRKKS